MTPTDRIIVALDFPSIEEARDMAKQLRGRVGVFKIGMELVYSGGLELARELAGQGEKVFLDLKLLDIGHTVMSATKAVSRLGVSFLTVHAVDEKTLLAAVEGRGDTALKLLGVTVMTNLDAKDLEQQGIAGLSPRDLAQKRAVMAANCGFDGVITSGHEAAFIRQSLGAQKLIITPGIRPAGADIDDQSRVMSPAQAVDAGADYLVIGRPITQAEDPVKAVEMIARELAS
ncbi:MAG: orotidine-5'-phosphate decarboxylase [Hyphomicrobiaceae bacterium]|nr:orotidine-5'-phosphate decarboxylase [Hyphomicrobiaceae bacterium]